MRRRLGRPVYHIVCGLVRLFYRKPRFEGLENVPEGPCVIVGNHAQMNGPIVADVYLPGEREIWCAGEMMELKRVPAYAFRDFWSEKPACIRWLFRLLSYVIAPLSVAVFNNAHCIGVFRDKRIMDTFRNTLEALEAGKRIVIFPETDPPFNNILYHFQDRFIDLGRMYARRAGKPLAFVPMYDAPALRRVLIGKPVLYDPAAHPMQERERVRDALMAAITDMALSLPRHRVVPYRNMPKKNYPYNLPQEVTEP